MLATRCRLTLTALLVLLGLVLLPALPAGAQSFEEGVGPMVQRVLEAWKNGDPKALTSMFTEKAELRDETGRWAVGHEEIALYFEEWMANADGAKEIVVERARQITERAGVVDVISAVVPEGGTFWGKETPRHAISVVVLEQPDGSWLFSSWRQCHSGR